MKHLRYPFARAGFLPFFGGVSDWFPTGFSLHKTSCLIRCIWGFVLLN